MAFFLSNIFKSIDKIKEVNCPILFIHGKKDTLIDISHSEELKNISNLNNNKKFFNELIPNEEMTHNEIDLEKDILQNILNFLEKNPNKVKNNHFNLFEKKFEDLFNIPFPIQKYLFIICADFQIVLVSFSKKKFEIIK